MLLIFAISHNLLHETFDGYPHLYSAEIETCKLALHPIWLLLKLGIKLNLKQIDYLGSNSCHVTVGYKFPMKHI